MEPWIVQPAGGGGKRAESMGGGGGVRGREGAGGEGVVKM